jgi:excisionase family DNA binding protein
MSTPEPWSILADVAGHLQVSEDTVLRWIAKRHLPAHRVGRIWRFKLTEVDAWVRAGGSPTDDDSQAGIRVVPGQG